MSELINDSHLNYVSGGYLVLLGFVIVEDDRIMHTTHIERCQSKSICKQVMEFYYIVKNVATSKRSSRTIFGISAECRDQPEYDEVYAIITRFNQSR